MSEAAQQPIFDPESAMKARQEGREVPITSYSVEEAVERGIFSFPPPLIERSPEPEMLYQEWRAFQWVFEDITDPCDFPPLPTIPSEHVRTFRRYVVAADELAESELLCGTDGYTVRWRPSPDRDGDSREVESRFSTKEITRGFATLLRQFDSRNEKASFERVSLRLRALSAEQIDSHERRRVAQIDSWRSVQAALHDAELHRLTRRKMGHDHGNPHPPSYYLKLYDYDDFIHWDRGRETLEQWEHDDHERSRHRLGFIEAACGLAYVYIGFSEVVRAAIQVDG